MVPHWWHDLLSIVKIYLKYTFLNLQFIFLLFIYAGSWYKTFILINNKILMFTMFCS